MRVPRQAIRLEFLDPHIVADGVRPQADRLYLDVGNALRPAVLDHKHLHARRGSAAHLVLAHPDLVSDAVKPGRGPGDPFVICSHRQPDLDSVCSVYLALAQLAEGQSPPGAAALVEYVDQRVAGHAGLSQQQPFTLYAAYYALAHRLSLRRDLGERQCWEECVFRGLDLVDFVVRQAAAGGRAIPDVDAFDCPNLFGAEDRELVTADLSRYRRKLADPRVKARRESLCLPHRRGGAIEVPALLVRHVQAHGDPGRCLFFKAWARSDPDAPGGDGFVALTISEPSAEPGRNRCVLSVRPESDATLYGLAPELERAETAERKRLGLDNREYDRDTGRARPRRLEALSADPWYDGRAFEYTILDSPSEGTLLTADRVEEIFAGFGRRPPDALAAPPPPREAGPFDVFISYPHAREEWVRQNVYEPLRLWLGSGRVFFDRHALPGGTSWLSYLAGAVKRSRVFLALYCREYFESEMCEYELQQAIVRDPVGRRRFVVPFAIERVSPPDYCSLIHYEAPPAAGFRERLLEVLRPILA